MALNEFVIKLLDSVHEEIQMSLRGMSLEQLMERPAPQSNSMGWLAWHIARLQDARAAALTGTEQLWVTDGWHARFSLPADPTDNGRGHKDAEVEAVKPDSAASVSGYAQAAHEFLRTALVKLDDAASTRPLNGHSGDATVADAVYRATHGGLAHVGQLMYVRGLIEQRRWFPR
jgi:hypothetical protein